MSTVFAQLNDSARKFCINKYVRIADKFCSDHTAANVHAVSGDGTHFHDTHAPVEEPSTASIADGSILPDHRDFAACFAASIRTDN